MRDLLIGCGNDRRKKLYMDEGPEWGGLVTMDHDPSCGADIVHDLEETPWPLPDDEFDSVHAYCVLEHLGRQGDFRSFFALFGEIYRVLKPGGMLFGIVPAWNDVWAWSDPSHTRVISRETLVFLNQAEYARQVGVTPMTDFRWLWKGDFEPVIESNVPGHFWFGLKAHKPVRDGWQAAPARIEGA